MNLLDSKSGRYVTICALYFSEGAPIGFIWWALPTLLRKSNLQIEDISGLIALLVFPWIFKFLWAPLIDALRTPTFGYKNWILTAQLFMGLTLIPLIFIDPTEKFFVWGILLFLHSLSAATQDVAIDALVINTISKNERGILNGYMQVGMLLGRSLFGGGTLIIAASFGLSTVVVLLICVIWSIMILLLFVEEPASEFFTQDKFKNVFNKLRIGFSSKSTWLVILFALTSGAAFEASGALAGPFLIDQQVDEQTIGFFFSIPVVAAMLGGGLIGGIISDKTDRKKSVAVFVIGFVLFALLISFIKFLNINYSSYVYLILFSGMYLFAGLFISSSYALFMDMTNPKIGATQFSTYMAATNGCEAWSVWIAGLVITSTGYSTAFVLMGIVSLLSIMFLFFIRTDNKSN